MSTLDGVLKKKPGPEAPVMPLPLAHLTDARYFGRIAASGGLAPSSCTRFGEDLVYLFYGGVFFRHSYEEEDGAGLLPVAFLFSPTILDGVSRYFPFDTGALV